MRFHLANEFEFKRIAKDLKAELERQEHPRTLAQCQNALARVHGYAHRDELLADIGRNPLSPGDDQIGGAEWARRLASHQSVLEKALDLPAQVALACVVEVGPTRIPRRRRIERPKAKLLLIDHDGWGGFALVGDSQIARGTTVFASRNGDVVLASFHKHAKSAPAALEMAQGRMWQVWLDRHMIAAIGLRPGVWRIDVEGATSERDNTESMSKAVDLLLRGVEREAFDAWLDLEGHNDVAIYDMLRGDDGDTRRLRGFAVAYPEIFTAVIAEDGRDRIVRHDDPREAWIDFISAHVQGGRDVASRLERDIPELGWVPTMRQRLGSARLHQVLGLLEHLPAPIFPTTRSDFEFFARACEHLGHMAPAPISVGIVASGDQEGWGHRLSTFEGRLWTLARNVSNALDLEDEEDGREMVRKGAFMVDIMFDDTGIEDDPIVQRVIGRDPGAVDELFARVEDWCVRGAPPDVPAPSR